MALTYNPGASDKDDVRLLIGDVDDTVNENARLEDADITRLLVLEGAVYRAAAMAADILAAKFARLGEGNQAPNNPASSRAAELRATAARLRSQSASEGAPVPTSPRHTSGEDRPPSFRIGMMDNS